MEALRPVRRWLHPVMHRLMAPRLERTARYELDGLEFVVPPGVFPPVGFGSSAILARFVRSLIAGNPSLLDLGTGSGVVGVMAARSGARVTAVDVSPVAVDCARANAGRNRVCVEVVSSDLFEHLGDRTFDLVAWNPPFFPRDPVTDWERAFFAGSGHRVIERFAEAVWRHVAPGGRVFLVLSEDAGLPEIRRVFEHNGSTWRVRSRRLWGLFEEMQIIEILRTASGGYNS